MWNLCVYGAQIMRAADCKPFVGKTRRVFRQPCRNGVTLAVAPFLRHRVKKPVHPAAILHPVPLSRILYGDTLLRNRGIADKAPALQVLPVHIHADNAVVIIGGVVVNAPVRVAAGGIEGDLVFSLSQMAAAALLVHGAENVEELADALLLALSAPGIQLRKGHPDKPGLGRKISRLASRFADSTVTGKMPPYGLSVVPINSLPYVGERLKIV